MDTASISSLISDLTASYSNESWSWMLSVFIVVLAVSIVDFTQRRVLNRMLSAAGRSKNPWDDSLLHAAQRPISLVVWVLGISLAIDVIGDEAKTPVLSIADTLREVLIIFALAWFLVRFIHNAEANLVQIRAAQGRSIDQTTVDAVAKFLRLSVYITTALIILQTLGFSVSGVLAFGGIGGMAVGFAAKDLLANFFGGLMIYMDRPFSVGDWIRSPDRSIEGTVENIGWRQTMIRTFDKRPLYVPNSTFSTIAVENPSRMSNRRIYETIGIRYDDADKMASITADVRTMLQNHPEIDTNQTLIVNFNSFAPSSLDFFIYTFTRTTNWVEFHAIKQDVMLKIIDIILGHGAECAFPTSTIHLHQEPPTQIPEAKKEAVSTR